MFTFPTLYYKKNKYSNSNSTAIVIVIVINESHKIDNLQFCFNKETSSLFENSKTLVATLQSSVSVQ